MLRKANVAIALSLSLHALPQQAFAQTTSSPNVTANNPPVNTSTRSDVTVSATRTVRKVDDVPSSVSVITDATIQKEGARNLKEAFRNELDVTVPVGPTRFGVGGASTGRGGQEGVNIRGLGGNQVLMLVDGIRTRTLGRVSMDMLCVDLTPVPAARVGTAVELWGEALPADEVAAAAGTGSYELICALAPRGPVSEARAPVMKSPNCGCIIRH